MGRERLLEASVSRQTPSRVVSHLESVLTGRQCSPVFSAPKVCGDTENESLDRIAGML